MRAPLVIQYLLFESQSYFVNDIYNSSQENTSRALVPVHNYVNLCTIPSYFKTYHKAVAKKVQVEPIYIGLSQTLKGNPVTRSFIKIPK
jgi:hypothetical protein